ncbi:integrase family protein [mine drainage metagenome]|uniref:Integrase family protein n=1 Tax=mine drainage metagenome TaxID=410659 RepID=T0ZRA6_9ZZZZ
MVFLLFLNLRRIDLEDRLNHGQLLSLGEIEELVGICRLPLDKINSMLDEAPHLVQQAATSIVSLEKLRMKSAGLPEIEIDPGSAATRLRNIRDYLRWLAIARMSKHGIDASLRITLESATQYTSHAIDARLPSASYKSGELDQREGLEPDVVEKILKVIDPHSSDNPWTDEHSRYRNALIIEWLLCFGMRRGELLNVRIGDIKFRDGTVTVVRRADNPNDPRRNQPMVQNKGKRNSNIFRAIR